MFAPHYDGLGVLPTASGEEIRRAYRRAAFVTHPDKGGSTMAFLRVLRAFEVLSDPDARQHYDALWLTKVYNVEHATSSAQTNCHSSTQTLKRKRQCQTTSNAAAGSHESGVSRGVSKMKVVLLDKLFSIVRSAPAQERRELLNALGGAVREELLKSFENQSLKFSPNVSSSQAPPACAGGEAVSSDSESEADLAIMDAELCGTASGSSAAADIVNIPRIRGVCKRSYGHSGRPMYKATICPMRGFRVNSALHDNLESAIESHIALTSAKRLVRKGKGPSEERVKRAFISLTGAKYCTQVYAYRLIGRKLYSPETPDVTLALSSWRKLWSALEDGWPSLREAWISVHLEGNRSMSTEAHDRRWGRSKGTDQRSREQLEAIVASWEADDANRRQRILAREKRQEERAAAAAEEELHRVQCAKERRLRLVAGLDNQLQIRIRKEENEVRKRKAEELRLRSRWHKQKHLTMEQILKGPPA